MLVLVVAGVLAAPAQAQVTLFTFSPPQPFTGEPVTFTSLVSGSIEWDLDGDGDCDDATGSVASYAYSTSGIHTVQICIDNGATTDQENVPVQNRPPTAAFTLVPGQPLARETVVLTSTSADPDGPVVAQEWDLNGDGVFGDATGEAALYSWRWPGTYLVGLRVTDSNGAAAVAQASVVVAPRPPGLLTPAPLVRVVGVPTDSGARLSLLTVAAPKGARVGIRCKGADCPYKHKRVIAKGGRIVLRAMKRAFDAGAVIEIRVTKPETIGHYTRLRIRAGDRPARVDRCLPPGKPNRPYSCRSG